MPIDKVPDLIPEGAFKGYNFGFATTNFPYKLRINISENSYTKENIDRIILLIWNLQEKYTLPHQKLLYGFKFADKDQFNEVYHKKLQFWRAKKQGNAAKAQEIANSFTDEETRKYYQNYVLTETSTQEVDAKIKSIVGFARFVGKGQFTLYLDFIDFNHMMLGMKTGFYVSAAQYIEQIFHPLALLRFVRELDQNLKTLGLTPGDINTTDSRISPFISFRQEAASTESNYIAATSDKEALAQNKKQQEEHVLYRFLKAGINTPKSYATMWNAATDTPQKILTILEDYTKGNDYLSGIKLFLCGHSFFGRGRHHIATVRTLIKSITDQNLTSTKEILRSLQSMLSSNAFHYNAKNHFEATYNVEGSLMRRIAFIHEKCFDEAKELEQERLEGVAKEEADIIESSTGPLL